MNLVSGKISGIVRDRTYTIEVQNENMFRRNRKYKKVSTQNQNTRNALEINRVSTLPSNAWNNEELFKQLQEVPTSPARQKERGNASNKQIGDSVCYVSSGISGSRLSRFGRVLEPPSRYTDEYG